MMILDLINPKNSDIPYKRFTFPDGQDHIQLGTTYNGGESVQIVTRLTSASDLFVLLQATEILRNSSPFISHISLRIHYLLAARMDRRMEYGQPITLKVVANMINAQGYDMVRIFDPHSDVALTLIDRSRAIANHEFVDWALDKIDVPLRELTLIAPDAGAAKKARALAEEFNLHIVYASKVRNPEDGKITKTVIDIDSLKDSPCLVVDDICDGGATFIALAEALTKKQAGRMFLAVSHGIFSKGVSPLALAGYEKIFTTNSFKEQTPHTNLLTYKLLTYKL